MSSISVIFLAAFHDPSFFHGRTPALLAFSMCSGEGQKKVSEKRHLRMTRWILRTDMREANAGSHLSEVIRKNYNRANHTLFPPFCQSIKCHFGSVSSAATDCPESISSFPCLRRPCAQLRPSERRRKNGTKGGNYDPPLVVIGHWSKT